jgi:hypothetical protein
VDHRLPRRPEGLDDDTVEALGTLSEGLEYVERARGRLYDFHQLTGRADLLFGQACEELRAAGHGQVADRLEAELVGRNVLEGRWTFQIVEDYDDGYWSAVRALEREVRDALAGGVRHILEAEMKADRITPGHPAHAPTPAEAGEADTGA